MGKLLICAFFMVVAFTIIDAAPSVTGIVDSVKKSLTSFLKLEDDALVTDICKALHKLVDSETEKRKQEGKSTSLPGDDPNKDWIQVCEKADAKIEDLIAVFEKIIVKAGTKQ